MTLRAKKVKPGMGTIVAHLGRGQIVTLLVRIADNDTHGNQDQQ